MSRCTVPFFQEFDEFRNLLNEAIENPSSMNCGETSGVSLYEDDEKMYIEAAVPGIKREDLQITFEKGLLCIKGEKKDENQNVRYHLTSKNSFSYCLTLPCRADEQVPPEAVCKDGVVKITFAKTKLGKIHRIEIKN